jgi:adenylosuccinate synthase
VSAKGRSRPRSQAPNKAGCASSAASTAPSPAERRCGWLDLVALRYAVRVNGMTSLALTKLDVLSDFDELPVCVRYRLRDGSETEHFPAHQSDFHHAEPVWERLAGWAEPLDNASTLDELPGAARRYVQFVSAALDVPIELVGVGAARERVLA